MKKLIFGLAFCLGCNATAAQLQQTAVDSFKLAGCVLGQVFAGNTDPVAISGVCVGALPSVIVDVVVDFQAKPAAQQAAVIGRALTVEQQGFLDEAKKRAVAKLAAKATSK